MTGRIKLFLIWTPLVLMSASAPFLAAVALRIENNTADMAQWLPDRRAERQQYDWFVRQFGADDVVLVSWPGCTLDDPRAAQLALELERRASSPDNPTRYVRSVLGAAELLEKLTSQPVNLSRRGALRRLQGLLVGPSGEQTCLVVQLTKAAGDEPTRAIRTIEDAARASGVPAGELRLGGSVFAAHMVDRESQRSLHQFVAQSCLVALAIAAFCLRSLRLTVVVLVTAAYSAALAIALVHFTRGGLNAVLIVMPTLIVVLTISAGVHLANYYREAIHEHGQVGASWRALRVGWQPCTLAAVSTAIGMFSLCISQIEPVRTFGLFSGLGVLASLAVLLVAFPTALGVWPRPANWQPRSSESTMDRWIERLARLIVRHHRFMFAGSLAIALLLIVGLARTTTSVKLERMFSSDSELIANHRWLEDNIGPVAGMEVVVAFGPGNGLELIDRARLVADIENTVRSLDEVTATLSAVTFLPPVPVSSGLRAAAERGVFRNKLARHRDELLDAAYFVEAESAQLWRISARIASLPTESYEAIVDQARNRIEKLLSSPSRAGVADVRMVYTGGFPLLDVSQRQLLYDFINSFLLAFVLICPVMMFILRGWLAGLSSMLPNVFPALAVFGSLGWLGVPIDIGTIVTASVALGIALDNTLHFLTWYRRGLGEGKNPRQAIVMAYRECAPAMIHTTLICSLGVLVFLQSGFLPSRRFALLLSILLVGALVGDLVLLPAMLAGMLGRFFWVSARRSRVRRAT